MAARVASHATQSAPRILDACWNRIGVRGDRSCPELVRHAHCRHCPVFGAAAIARLDHEPLPGQLAEATRLLAEPAHEIDPEVHSALLFRIGAEWLALDACLLDEILDLRAIHSLPRRRSRIVLGLVNVRGELVVCVSLAEALALDTTATRERGVQRAAPRRLLAVDRAGARFAFPVDEVHGIERFHPHRSLPVPATMARATACHTRAVLPWREAVVGWLDPAPLWQSLERGIA